MNHKSAWAEEETAPSFEVAQEQVNKEVREPRRILVKSSSTGENPRQAHNNNVPIDILIVASKLKNYVKEKHDFNTSSNVMDKLSDLVRNLVDDAIVNARNDGRKTLMDRDF